MESIKESKESIERSQEMSEGLRELLTPKEGFYSREIIFSGVFENEADKYDPRLKPEFEFYLLPIIKDYLRNLVMKGNVYDAKKYITEIDRARNIYDFPVIEFLDKWKIFSSYEGWKTLFIADDRDFILQIIETNIDKLPLELLFKEDIIKKDNKYYAIPKLFKPNIDTTGNYSCKVSSWHKSSRFPVSHYNFTIKGFFKPKKVGVGRYTTIDTRTGEYVKIYIPEYIMDELVEIDMDATFSNYRKEIIDFGEPDAYQSRDNKEEEYNAISNEYGWKDPLFDEMSEYFERNLNKDDIIG